ncbi:MAG: YitT family protein [Anaerolineaceae bacterium]
MSAGVAADRVSEGSNIVRTAFIITKYPDEVIHEIMEELERGVTVIPATGGYSGEAKTMLYCVVTTTEVVRLKTMVHDIDPKAFMVIGQANEALGEGFKPLHEI